MSIEELKTPLIEPPHRYQGLQSHLLFLAKDPPGNDLLAHLPMTLDISHIHDNQKIWELLKGYKDNIVNVHLSAKGNNKHHLPIDNFCKEVIDYLIENKWSGNVILEYLPEFHNQMIADVKFLEYKYT